MGKNKRIVLTSHGGAGDVQPFIALAQRLKSRGHHVIVATAETFKSTIESSGLEFHAVRPNRKDDVRFASLTKQSSRDRATSYFVGRVLVSHLKASYEDLLAGADGADLLITNQSSFAGQLVAEKLKMKWATCTLQPILFFSALDPPVIPSFPLFNWLRPLGPSCCRLMLRIVKKITAPLLAPVTELRKEIGLPKSAASPLLEGHSKELTLGLFSPVLADRMPDWPSNSLASGFTFFQGARPFHGVMQKLNGFLESGSPPVVFTLGTTMIEHAGNFFIESVKAVKALGLRAVLLFGRAPFALPSPPLPKSVFAVSYVPYFDIFPKACAIVHQGGIGTTGEALRAGKPMLVVPYTFDQPDNAMRLVRAGVARKLSRSKYTATKVAEALARLLNDPAYSRRADELRIRLSKERGVETACDAIERYLRS